MSEEEFARDARRVLRRLGHGWLEPLNGESYALKMGGKPMATRVSVALVAELLKRDWIRPRAIAPGTFALSDAGRGWLIRSEAVEEPFAAQHQLRRKIETAQSRTRVVLNEGESPIGWLKKRGMIDAVQFDAGERLRRDFTIAQLTPRMGVDLSAPVVLGSRGANATLAISDTALAAKQRFRQAMKAAGPGLSDLLFDVCCHLKGLEEAERAKGWPRRSAKIVLHIALDRLALHYGMRAPSRAKTRAWRSEAE